MLPNLPVIGSAARARNGHAPAPKTAPASSGAYSASKFAAHPDRLKVLREGGSPYPVHLHLIVSDACSLGCKGCAYRMEGYSSNQLFGVIEEDGTVNNNPNRMLPFELVTSVLDDCAEMGTKGIEITGGGEPTLHPKLAEIIDYAHGKGLDVALITHGLHLQKVMAQASRCTWVRISIDAATPRTYGIVRESLGGPHGENLYRALASLHQLATRKAKEGTAVTIGTGFVVQAENWHELYDAVRLYRDAGAENVRISGLFTPMGDSYHDGHRDAAIELERRAVEDFSRDGFTVHGRFHEKIADLAGSPTIDRCWYQETTLYLGGDQNLYRCCVTAFNRQGLIGSVGEAGGLKKLLDSELKRERFANFSAKSCQVCQFRDKLESIEALVKAPTIPPVPHGIVHANFV